MAGIIGQITAQARVRRLKKKVSIDKCNYILPPFSSNGFDASLHNNYVRNKIRNNDRLRQERQEEEEKVQSELEQIDMILSTPRPVPFSWVLVVQDCVIIFIIVTFLPSMFLLWFTIKHWDILVLWTHQWPHLENIFKL